MRQDDFVKGSAANPWPEVFDEFSEQIRKHIGDKTHDLLTPEYSTTGPVEKAAAQVVLMDSFKKYFRKISHLIMQQISGLVFLQQDREDHSTSARGKPGSETKTRGETRTRQLNERHKGNRANHNCKNLADKKRNKGFGLPQRS